MEAPSSSSPGINLSTTFGCMLAGCFLSCIMWGISSLQTFLYFALYENDSWRSKLLVAFLWVFDTANEILVLKALWPTLIQHWGDPNQLTAIIPELTHHGWVAQIVEFSVQLYFIRRIYIFSGKKWLFPAIMTLFSLFQLVILIPYDILTVGNGGKFSVLSEHEATSMVIALRAVTAAEDVLLSGTLIYIILRGGLPHFHQTRKLVVRLLVVSANTGLWTAIVAFVELALVAAFPSGLQFCVPEFPLCSLYFSSLLASLNARDYIRGDSDTVDVSASRILANSNLESGGTGTLFLGPLGRSKASGSSGTKASEHFESEVL